jgi:alkylhydroperoxidase/carboxymuconolactone decarboxylase family protein YurZ
METQLDARTQVLVALGAAVAAKCQDCFAKLYETAGRIGVSDREVRAVVAIAAKVSEKSHGFMAAFVERTTMGAVPGGRAAGGGDGGCGCA